MHSQLQLAASPSAVILLSRTCGKIDEGWVDRIIMASLVYSIYSQPRRDSSIMFNPCFFFLAINETISLRMDDDSWIDYQCDPEHLSYDCGSFVVLSDLWGLSCPKLHGSLVSVNMGIPILAASWTWISLTEGNSHDLTIKDPDR